ncbi:hypothetical protein, partial [Pauljensenia sp. OF14-1SRA]|uniref:hypothetical protein n=1 Tax=Pauljensenia sp. OF14-1SRA TaxID=2998062 RepID=UPI0022E4E147
MKKSNFHRGSSPKTGVNTRNFKFSERCFTSLAMVASACKAIEGLLAIHEFTVTRDAESTQRQSPSTPAWEQRKLGEVAEING